MKPSFFTCKSQYNFIQFPDHDKRGTVNKIYAQVVFFLSEKERKQFLIRMKKTFTPKKLFKIK